MGSSLLRWSLTALLLALIGSQAVAQPRNLAIAQPDAGVPEKRFALVIGNSGYKSDRLKNPVNDADDMARALRALDFKVTLRSNVTQRQMKAAIREFSGELKRGGVGLWVYSPIDARRSAWIWHLGKSTGSRLVFCISA